MNLTSQSQNVPENTSQTIWGAVDGSTTPRLETCSVIVERAKEKLCQLSTWAHVNSLIGGRCHIYNISALYVLQYLEYMVILNA